jgi:hypothetical protein
VEYFQARAPTSSGGVILTAGPRGCRGFRVVPGVPSKNDAGNTSVKLRPGSFPVRVRERGTQKIIPLHNSDSFYFGEEFGKQQGFDLLDVEDGDCWDVYLFDGPEDGVTAGGKRRTVPVRVADSAAVPNAVNPTLATEGYALRPGMVSITSYFGGTARACTLWVRQLDGTWFNTGEVVDNTIVGAVLYDTRTLNVPGDRMYWSAAGAAQTVVVEAEMEVG